VEVLLELNEAFIEGLALDPIVVLKGIAEDTGISLKQVNTTVMLLKDGNTIPFISRYRKEVTGELDEVQIRAISHKLEYLENLEGRRVEVIKSIFSQGKLTDDLYANIMKCGTQSELEDLYAPYKRKKKTRGMIAIEKGLSELADLMQTVADIEREAARFVDAEKGVETEADALQGAMDIIAERVAQDVDNRKAVREHIMGTGSIVTKGLKNEAESVYKMYYDFKEPLRQVRPHRILAINRGEKEEELEVKIDFDVDANASVLVSRYKIANVHHREAILDGLKRLLLPSILREIRSNFSDEADLHGISVFAENLKGLLMQPPIQRTRILGVDPGIRTGTKCAAVDENGRYLGDFLFYQRNEDTSKAAIAAAVQKYKIQLIAVGNGTGSHEAQQIVAGAIADFHLPVEYTVVAEDGASVYSASEIAGEEFPDLDVTIRGAISLARRIQDPLAEFVKIDPKSIGVGLYQHDVNQKSLSDKLDETVESVVNSVGVNINTASVSLLRYVSGVTSSIARHIVEFRDKVGIIRNRDDLRKIAGVGDKTFQQAAGFLKIPESKEPLDNTWVHPENYAIGREVLESMKEGKDIGKEAKKALAEKFNVGLPTVNDIIEELRKPNRDPRSDYPMPILQKGVVSFEDLKVGMKVKGKIKNVVDFGAFVDVGIKETALVHVSQCSDSFVKHPNEVLKVGDVKEFSIIEMDSVRKRIALSLKSNPGQAASGPRKEASGDRNFSRDDGTPRKREEINPVNYSPLAEALRKLNLH
jgi:uncharacterized protein